MTRLFPVPKEILPIFLFLLFFRSPAQSLDRPEDWLRGPELLQLSSERSLRADRGDVLISRAVFPVRTGFHYRLSGIFQVPEGKKETRVFFGIVCLDKYRRIISPEFVQAKPETLTELAEPVRGDQDELRVRSAARWTCGSTLCVAFDVAPDGRLDDIPNRKVSSVGIREILREKDRYLIRLNGPARFDFPAGTRVRLHESGATYHYTGGAGVMVGVLPKKLEGVIGGFGETVYSPEKFYPGTHACRIVILPNYNMPPESSLLFSSLSLRAEPDSSKRKGKESVQ